MAFSQSLIESGKDRESREELGKRDSKIAELNDSSAKTSERASKLEVQAESLRADAERSRASMALAQAEAAKANAASKQAVAKVADAEARSLEASAKAEAFRLDIAKANESADKARAQGASATAEAAKANLELARLNAEMADRVFSSEQKVRLQAAIARIPRVPLFFLSPITDGESERYARQIMVAFSSSVPPWSITGNLGSGEIRPHRLGAIRLGARDQSSLLVAAELQKAFIAIGIPVDVGQMDENNPLGTIIVFVAAKH